MGNVVQSYIKATLTVSVTEAADRSVLSTVTSENKPPRRRVLWVSAVVIGLLSALLVAAVIFIVLTFVSENTKTNVMKMWITNLTNERDRLQKNYSNLTNERDGLQKNYSDLTNERDGLQKNYSDLTNERDGLQKNYSDLTNERDGLQKNYSDLTNERDGLQKNYSDLTNERDGLQKNYSDLTNERDGLKEQIATLNRDRKDQQNELTGLGHMITKNWAESKEECEEHGATLVIISSPEEQRFVSTLSKKRGQNVWIGLTDRETENQWEWVNGDRANTTYWTSHQPDNWGGAEHCGEIRYHDQSWNDNRCSVKKLSISPLDIVFRPGVHHFFPTLLRLSLLQPVLQSDLDLPEPPLGLNL
ncbi:hypothetical protein WMY93_000112 [Mugilogobius chulae]|uniref:C-type lectin domain-containing protein n=1 Tax=Mugilogobius chulae TaxID=88201 RepID=A0AAW0Q449_9GOBI